MCERKKVGNGVRPLLIELRLECSCSICAYVRERDKRGGDSVILCCDLHSHT